MTSKHLFVIPLLCLLLVGAGCVATEVSSLTPEEATASLSFVSGNELVIRPTVLGVGGKIVGWLGADEEERAVTIDSWTAGERVGLSWSIKTQVETAGSKAAQSAYDVQVASSPVGTEIPEPPEPTYEERVVEGTIASTSMKSTQTLMLPEAWPEEEVGEVEASLVWLSRDNYEELVNTRKTKVSLGLFDESLLKVEDATGRIKSVVDSISGLLSSVTGSTKEPVEEAVDTDSLLTLEAEADWGEFTLLVDNVRTTVRVIEAKNAFASYKILANVDNPLILEIQLTPLSQGNLELLSKDGISEGFGGYEVTRINVRR
ncbi:MAG: hypothetical protein UY76_C0058G0005 [Candidatus Uhrbacteria bacterium GW2011_GWA2_52_8d]|uniref:Uncharacterized protein n=1 Tax=Candidatus Uhrbacteria bacterium GW2011_GWA2_52_8d TaxID=1618979 RepID=A0A0G1ZSW4_9BACT|nr:MAG: hypothetical protein UY76_C0058G0005 [Candidatus Uhrbacteria bacterium GW2011_GWA2_52_8d]